MLLFLGVDPYWQKFWWNKLLFEPFIGGMKQPLYAAVSQVLWRTAKDDVIDQVRELCLLLSFDIGFDHDLDLTLRMMLKVKGHI